MVKKNLSYFKSIYFKLKMALYKTPPLKICFFEYQLSTNRGKFKNLIWKGHTGHFSRWCTTGWVLIA